MTARDLQDRDVQYTRAKGFDTFAPFGPCVSIGVDPGDLEITTRVNGQVRQHSRTSQLIFSPLYLVWYVSQIMTLLPGDVISTGTPAGIAPIQAGDVIEVEIESIGILRNPVAKAS
jgi:2-keto-4-pentenoate hydratase/2-oxohepta-3-ene-1,7-dioic acid hydratase in catechol pathway